MGQRVDAAQLAAKVELHLLRAARSSSEPAKVANLNLAAILATQSERLRRAVIERSKAR